MDSEDGRLFALSGAQVKTIKKPDGTTLLSNQSFDYRADGEYVYLWDTSTLTDADAGDYHLTVEATINFVGKKVARRQVIRLLKQGAP